MQDASSSSDTSMPLPAWLDDQACWQAAADRLHHGDGQSLAAAGGVGQLSSSADALQWLHDSWWEARVPPGHKQAPGEQLGLAGFRGAALALLLTIPELSQRWSQASARGSAGPGLLAAAAAQVGHAPSAIWPTTQPSVQAQARVTSSSTAAAQAFGSPAPSISLAPMPVPPASPREGDAILAACQAQLQLLGVLHALHSGINTPGRVEAAVTSLVPCLEAWVRAHAQSAQQALLELLVSEDVQLPAGFAAHALRLADKATVRRSACSVFLPGRLVACYNTTHGSCCCARIS